MPALPPVPGAVKIQWLQTLGEDVSILNNSYWTWQGVSSTSNWTNLANALTTVWGNNLGQILSDELELTGLNIVDLSAVGDPAVTYLGNPLKGGQPTESEAANVNTMVQNKIARRYRGGKPRWYQCGIPIGVRQDSQKWAPSWVTSFSTAWANFILAAIAVSSAGVKLSTYINISYYEGFTPFEKPSGRYINIPKLRTTPLTDTITESLTSPVICSQRRRTKS